MNRFRPVALLLLLFLVKTGTTQTTFSGKVKDGFLTIPLASVKVSLKGTHFFTFTNERGYYYLSKKSLSDSSGISFKSEFSTIYWQSASPVAIKVFNIQGKLMFSFPSATSGSLPASSWSNGIYILQGEGTSIKERIKILVINETPQVLAADRIVTPSLNSSDTLVFEKAGYKSTFICDSTNQFNLVSLYQNSYGDADYFELLPNKNAYDQMKGPPLNQSFGEVSSVKIVYSIQDDRIYYINSTRYDIHYDFAASILSYKKGHYMFNVEEYSNNLSRLYFLAGLNYYSSSGTYTLEFFPGDELNCDQIFKVYQKVKATSYIQELYLLTNSRLWESCSKMSRISANELFKGQNYQALTNAENYGYLKKVVAADISKTFLGRHDIALIKGLPLDIPVVAGVITNEFQAPLSHVNVLSHNRGTPNMGLRDGWTNQRLNELLNKLVYLKVTPDSFIIRAASLSEAQAFWNKKEPSLVHHLECDQTSLGLIDLKNADHQSTPVIGAKAANFAEMVQMNAGGSEKIPLPEGAFAIPMSYYFRHMKEHGLDQFLVNMLSDEKFKTDAAFRDVQLKILRDSIKHEPLSASLLQLVLDKIKASSGFDHIRFRSSTNAEDIEGFNGAGLYSSHTGWINDPDKSVEEAIKKVWASLWELRAFEEREYFKIDELTVGMGILVHRSFPDEDANGVVITKNLYNPNNPALTINVQNGEFKVVDQGNGYLPDQIIFYPYGITPNQPYMIDYVHHSDEPDLNGKSVMSDYELKQLADYCQLLANRYTLIYHREVVLDIEFKLDSSSGTSRKIYIKQVRIYE